MSVGADQPTAAAEQWQSKLSEANESTAQLQRDLVRTNGELNQKSKQVQAEQAKLRKAQAANASIAARLQQLQQEQEQGFFVSGDLSNQSSIAEDSPPTRDRAQSSCASYSIHASCGAIAVQCSAELQCCMCRLTGGPEEHRRAQAHQLIGERGKQCAATVCVELFVAHPYHAHPSIVEMEASCFGRESLFPRTPRPVHRSPTQSTVPHSVPF